MLSPSQAQQRLWDGWVNIYGKDPTMAGFFAYSETLLRSAERGQLPMAEAQEMVKVRETAVWAEYKAAKHRSKDVANTDYDF